MTAERDGVPVALSRGQASLKRAFDLVIAGIGTVLTAPVMGGAWMVAALSTRANGFFRQERIGLGGETFEVWKIRTMRTLGGTTVTKAGDARITRAGAWMRKLKIDELPQLVNVLRGEMSLVGPRPDVPGYADRLTGADRVLLSVRPGITSPAAVVYRHEESLLARAEDPEAYNRDVLWPAKVRINREYLESWSMRADLRCLWATVAAVLSREEPESQ